MENFCAKTVQNFCALSCGVTLLGTSAFGGLKKRVGRPKMFAEDEMKMGKIAI